MQRSGWWSLLLLLTPCTSYAQSAVADRAATAALEQLPCINTPAPRAERRAAQVAQNASAGTVVVKLLPLDSVRAGTDPQVQLWGSGGGAGGPVDSVGVATISDRTPGLYRLAVRSTASQPSAWSYVFPLRPGRVDTIWVNLGAQCTQITK